MRSPTKLPAPINAGTLFFNKYKCIRLLGEGAFGEVHLAKDVSVDSSCALKILKECADGKEIADNLQEAAIGHRLNHNNLVHIYQADVSIKGNVILAMEYLPKGAITRQVNSLQFIPLNLVLKYIKEILSGLEYLHQNNIIHNDIKPRNILLGNNDEAKLADYGIAVIIQNGTYAPVRLHYALHTAPEIISGKGIDKRTDIFQLGLTMFRLLCGSDFLKEQYKKMGKEAYKRAICKGSLITKNAFPPFIPNSVRRIVLKAIAPDPKDRFQTALEMRRALEKLSFPGEWTVDNNKKWWGANGHNKYDFEESHRGGLFQFDAFKENSNSGNRRRIARFSKKGIKEKVCLNLKAEFMKAVVDGKI